VKECIHLKTGEKRAIKFVSRAGDERFSAAYIKETTETEMDILCSIFNDNIVQLKDIFITATHYCIVMELVTGGELFEKIVQLSCYSESKAAELIYQVFEGICALHDAGIVHRDLKPENLLLSSPDEDAIIKVADFGLAKRTNGEACFDSCGTMMYLAPEMIINSRAQQNFRTPEGYDLKVDVWATGVILYIMLCGFPPYYDEDNSTMFEDIINLPPSFPSPEWDAISTQGKDFVKLLLEKNPSKRLSARQALQHPWVQAGEGKSKENLAKTINQLKKFNARRKFRGAIIATKALNKLRISINNSN
jgi:serine/threonine protein kinase